MLSARAFKLKFGYKIFLKGVEMSKFLNFKIALPVAILVMGSGSASAALNCTTQPTCTELGYSKSKVEGCESYVLCPFDTSYMACTKYGEGQCSNGYAKTVADCGTSGSSGWTLGTAEDSAGCYQCTAKTCPTGYTAGNYGVCLSGYKAEYHSTAYAGNTKCYRCVKDCPAGYSTSQLRICPSGQTLQEHATVKGCYGCVTLQCTEGYAKSAADCGTTGTKGWTLGTDTDAAGCFKCEMKTCPTGTRSSCNSHAYESGSTNYYRGDDPCVKCTTCPNNGYAIGSGKGGCDSGQIRVESSDPKCYECKTGYDREQYGCNIEHAITVDADGNPTSDKYFDHCSCYWNDGYCNTAWVEEHGLCKKGDTHCFYCPGPGCNGGW